VDRSYNTITIIDSVDHEYNAIMVSARLHDQRWCGHAAAAGVGTDIGAQIECTVKAEQQETLMRFVSRSVKMPRAASSFLQRSASGFSEATAMPHPRPRSARKIVGVSACMRIFRPAASLTSQSPT
jgi:hypothetical protein